MILKGAPPGKNDFFGYYGDKKKKIILGTKKIVILRGLQLKKHPECIVQYCEGWKFIYNLFCFDAVLTQVYYKIN